MVEIDTDDKTLNVRAESYEFSLDGETLTGKLVGRAEGAREIRVNFAPEVNGQAVEARVADISAEGSAAVVKLSSTGGQIALNLWFGEHGLAYAYALGADRPIESFRPGRIEGDFFQVRNFDPDLERFDIPRRIVTPLQIASCRRTYDHFFQLDAGNYMMPAYLVGLFDQTQYVGVGLLEVPDSAIPFDGRVTVSDFTLRFEYASGPGEGDYRSPAVWIGLADRPTELLGRYREAIDGHEAGALRIPPHEPARPEPWWLEPIYTTWGDQVYTKYVEQGQLTSEVGSEKYLSADLVEVALDRLASQHIHPKTIVLDEGWSGPLGDWQADDARFGGSLTRWVKDMHRRGYRIVLYFNPFLVSQDSAVAGAHREFLLTGADGRPVEVSRSGRDYYLFDWSHADLRRFILQRLAAMAGPDGLDADGIKISGTKFLPSADARFAEGAFGVGERYLLAVLEEIHKAIKQAKPDAPICLPCLNPLFRRTFDIVRLGNISEINHDLYVSRAETASYLLPGVPIDTDDWACWQKVIGDQTFRKVVCGIPNVFSSQFRGDGRFRWGGAMGGNPVSITPEQYRVIATAWRMYEASKDIPRAGLRIDFDRMEFSTPPSDRGYIRTYQGGYVLAVYRAETIELASLLAGKVIIDLPEGFNVAAVEAVDFDNHAQAVEHRLVLGNRLVFEAVSSRDQWITYRIRRK